MAIGSPAHESLRSLVSKRRVRLVSPDEAREAAESLLGYFRVLLEWDRKLRGAGSEFETGEVRGVATSNETAYPRAS